MPEPEPEEKLICGIRMSMFGQDAIDAGDIAEDCDQEAISVWTIGVLGKPQIENLHVCQKHDIWLCNGAIAINRRQIKQVVLAQSGIVTPQQVLAKR